MSSMESGQDAIADIVGKRIAFVGKLGSMNRRQAARLLRQCDASATESIVNADIVVIGADEIPLDDDSLLDESIRDAAAQGDLEIITETDLWNRLGLVENENNIRRLYTPAMLAQLLNVPVSVIRRWHHRGLIIPTREVHRLPYFDFQEVATAKRLAELLAAGASANAIEKKLAQLSNLVPGVDRPLAQLSVIVEGRQILLRKGAGLIEPGGQMHFDFEGHDADAVGVDETSSRVLRIQEVLSSETNLMSTQDMVQMATQFEDEGAYHDAIEMYRATLMSGGLDAGICFRLAELLYVSGDLTGARERYSVAIELDEDFVEARANLGCVLAELGDAELAVAAFRGAIKFHPDYPDVHYHLAQSLFQLGERDEATEHWRTFLSLAPDSPWADEARHRLGIEGDDDLRIGSDDFPFVSKSDND